MKNIQKIENHNLFNLCYKNLIYEEFNELYNNENIEENTTSSSFINLPTSAS